MRTERSRGPDMGAVGWVSVADALIISLILVLTVCLLAQGLLRVKIEENEKLRGEITAICGETSPAEMAAALDRLRKENDALRAERDAARKLLTDMTAARDQLKTALAVVVAERDQLKVDLTAAASARDQLKTDLAAVTAERDKWKEMSAFANAENATLRAEIKRLRAALDAASRQAEAEAASRRQVNKELLGLNGDLKRVVVVFDKSESMKNPPPGRQTASLEPAKNVVKTWVNNLRVEQMVLIVYSDEVAVFPPAGGWYTLTGPTEAANRKALIDSFSGTRAEGETHTYAALRKAYEYRPDTIILFTDGAPTWEPTPARPTRPPAAQAEAAIMAEIHTLCRSQRTAAGDVIPVNVVALGDYYTKRTLSEFLIKLADDTKGVFLGR